MRPVSDRTKETRDTQYPRSNKRGGKSKKKDLPLENGMLLKPALGKDGRRDPHIKARWASRLMRDGSVVKNSYPYNTREGDSILELLARHTKQ